MNYTPSKDALVAHLDGEAVLLHARTHSYYRLNETAQRVWQLLEQQQAFEQMVERLVAEYDIDAASARAEVTRLLAEFDAAGLVVASP